MPGCRRKCDEPTKRRADERGGEYAAPAAAHVAAVHGQITSEKAIKTVEEQGEMTRTRVGDVETLVKDGIEERARDLASAERYVAAFLDMQKALEANDENKEPRKSKKQVAEDLFKTHTKLGIGVDQFLRLYDGKAPRGDHPNWLIDLKAPTTGFEYIRSKKSWYEARKRERQKP